MQPVESTTSADPGIEGRVRPAKSHERLRAVPEETSIVALIEERAAGQGDRIALREGNTEVDYGSFNRRANRVAHALIARHGSRHPLISVVMDHGIDKVVVLTGVLKAGFGYAMLNGALADHELAELINHAETQLVVTDDAHLERIRGIAGAHRDVVSIETLLEFPCENNPGIATTPDTLSSVSYTSGSTGQPKGVARDLGHEFLCIRALYNGIGLGADDRVILLQNLWFTHVFSTLAAGATLVLFDLRHDSFSALARLLRDEAITSYGGMATGFLQFLHSLEPGDFFPAMRVVELTGEPVGAEDLARFRRAFPADCVLITSYTSSEQARMANLVIGPAAEVGPGSILPVGRPAEGIEIALVDGDLHPVAEGEIGEIAVSSAWPSPGYWRDPERTARTWVRRPSDGCLLYLSGDMGRLDAAGHLHVVGRKDDQIKIRGRLFFSSEIEGAVQALPGIRQSAVVTFSGEVTDERFACFYVAEDGTDPTPADLRAGLTPILPAHKIPNAFVRLETMPLTQSGKINRRELPRDRLAAETAAANEKDGLHQVLFAVIAAAGRLIEIDPEASFIACGGDSLAALETALAIEREFTITIDPEDLLDDLPLRVIATQIAARLAPEAAALRS